MGPLRRISLLLVGVMLLAACGDAATTTTTSVTTSSTLATTTTTAATSTTAAAFPVTVEAGNGPVTIEERPQRVVSLSATHTEVLYAIGAGDQVVGTDLTSNYPPEAEATARVDAFNFDVEEVAALSPDLVVLAFDFGGEVAALDAIAVTTLLLPPPATLEGALDQMRLLGEVTGHAAAADALATDQEQRIAAAVASVPAAAGGMTFFHEVDATLFSANSSTFLGDLYARLGLVNIADEVPDEFASGYVQVSPELILGTDPDFIFLADAAFGETAEAVATRPGWAELSAVQEGRVVELDGDVAGRWGPRTAGLVEQIAAAVAGAVG